MNDDIKLGYNIACNRLNEDIDTMIDELHDAYMRQADEKVKDRIDAQIQILWSFKSRIEDCIAESIGRAEAIKECVNKYTEMIIDEYHLRTDLQILSIKRLEQKVLAKMAGGENA